MTIEPASADVPGRLQQPDTVTIIGGCTAMPPSCRPGRQPTAARSPPPGSSGCCARQAPAASSVPGTGPPPTPASTTLGRSPFCWTRCVTPRPATRWRYCWPAIRPPTSASTVRREDVGAAVRDAITRLSARTGEHTAGNRTVMFIPDLPYTLRNDLGVTASQSRDGRSGAHDPVARRLGLNDSLGSRIAGTIEDVPVFLTGSLQEQVLVIDLARFADLRRDTPGSAGSPDPELMLQEPVDPLRSLTGSGNAESDLVGGSLLDLLQVRLILSLATNIEVDEAAAVRIIRIE
jgi:hypothetical protein